VNTTINGIIYTDRHLAIYKVGKLLLPMDFFSVAKAPSLAPEPSAMTLKADKEKAVSPDSSYSSQVKPANDNSGTVKINAYGKWMTLVLCFGAVTLTSLST